MGAAARSRRQCSALGQAWIGHRGAARGAILTLTHVRGCVQELVGFLRAARDGKSEGNFAVAPRSTRLAAVKARDLAHDVEAETHAVAARGALREGGKQRLDLLGSELCAGVDHL